MRDITSQRRFHATFGSPFSTNLQQFVQETIHLPDEVDEMRLVVGEVLPRLAGEQLADEFGQAVVRYCTESDQLCQTKKERLRDLTLWCQRNLGSKQSHLRYPHLLLAASQFLQPPPPPALPRTERAPRLTWSPPASPRTLPTCKTS